MGKVPFITDNYRNRIPINWYPAKDDEAGIVLWATPGLEEWVDIGVFPVRAMRVVDNILYVVAGSGFYTVGAGGATFVDNITAPFDGPVFLVDDGFHVVVLAPGVGGWYYTIATGAFAAISFGFTPACVAYQDGYFIVGEDDNAYGKFWVSDSYDPTTYDAVTGYAYPEGDSDGLVGMISDHRELWLFGSRTTEVWYNAGDEFPFTRNSAGFIPVGCEARHSIAQFDNSVVWLTNHLQVVRAEGYTPRVISTRKLEREWQGYGTTSDAEGFAYVYEGHWMYHLSFPDAGKTWVFDGATGLWHQRASYPNDGRHWASCHAFFGGKHIVGDYRSGKLYEMSSDVYDDDGKIIRRILETAAVNSEGALLRLPGLRIDFEEGTTNLQSGQGSDPQAMLQWSDDGGHTWGNEHWASIGKVGEYGKRAIWRRMGASRDRVFRLTITDPVPCTITGWNLMQPALGR